jgi:hypothetical protein
MGNSTSGDRSPGASRVSGLGGVMATPATPARILARAPSVSPPPIVVASSSSSTSVASKYAVAMPSEPTSVRIAYSDPSPTPAKGTAVTVSPSRASAASSSAVAVVAARRQSRMSRSPSKKGQNSAGHTTTAAAAGGLLDLPSDLFLSLLYMSQPRELALLTCLSHRGYHTTTNGVAVERLWDQWLMRMYPDIATESKVDWPRRLFMTVDDSTTQPLITTTVLPTVTTTTITTAPTAYRSTPPSASRAIPPPASPANDRRSSFISATSLASLASSSPPSVHHTISSNGNGTTAMTNHNDHHPPHHVSTSSGGTTVRIHPAPPPTIVSPIEAITATINGIERRLQVCSRTLLIQEHNRVPLQIAKARAIHEAAARDAHQRWKFLCPCRTFDGESLPAVIGILVICILVSTALRFTLGGHQPYFAEGGETPVVEFYYMLPMIILILFLSALYYGNWILIDCPTRFGLPSNILQSYEPTSSYCHDLISSMFPLFRFAMCIVPLLFIIWVLWITIRLSGAISTSYVMIGIPLVLAWIPCLTLILNDCLAFIGVIFGIALPWSAFIMLAHWKLDAGWLTDTTPSMALVLMPLFIFEAMACLMSLYCTGRNRNCIPWFIYLMCITPIIIFEALIVTMVDSGRNYTVWLLMAPLIVLVLLPVLYIMVIHQPCPPVCCADWCIRECPSCCTLPPGHEPDPDDEDRMWP